MWHGSNDWYWGTDIAVFRESVREAADTIRERNPFVPLIWFSPLVYRLECPDGGKQKGEAAVTANKAGLTMPDYIEALREEAVRGGFFFGDISSSVQINRYNAAVFLEDGVHPSRKGYDRIEKAIIQTVRMVTAIAGDGNDC